MKRSIQFVGKISVISMTAAFMFAAVSIANIDSAHAFGKKRSSNSGSSSGSGSGSGDSRPGVPTCIRGVTADTLVTTVTTDSNQG